jgi:AP-3 complex subunit delta
LTYLLQPRIANLAPDIIAVYIHAATKIFGFWATEMAERWDDDLLPEIKNVVDMVIERVSDFNSSPHIEVQERASDLCPALHPYLLTILF